MESLKITTRALAIFLYLCTKNVNLLSKKRVSISEVKSVK